MLIAAPGTPRYSSACEEVLEAFAPETIRLENKRKKNVTPLGCWPSVLGQLGVFSSFGCPALGVCLLPGEGLAAGLGDEDIAKVLNMGIFNTVILKVIRYLQAHSFLFLFLFTSFLFA